jgi:hypothetical protein
LQDRSFKNAVFENPQKVNKLNEEASILNEIDAQPKPIPEQNRYILEKYRPGLPRSPPGKSPFSPREIWPGVKDTFS